MAQTKNWILLRGLARGAGHWGSFVETLKERHPESQFEFLDLPGNGARHNEKSPTRISDYVKDLRARSEFVKKGEPFVLLAVSLGAMISVEWMREFPHEVRKAYLICTSSAGLSPFHQRFLLSNYLKSAQLIHAHSDGAEWEKNILEMITNSHERREHEMPALISYSQAHPVKLENVLRQMLAASKYKFPEDAPGEVSLIGSHGDRLVSPQCTLQIAKKWQMKATMHAWAGHDIPIDDPRWLVEHLL